MKISNLALVAALAFTGITASNASLTDAGIGAIFGTDSTEANAVGTLFPTGDVEDQVTTLNTALGGVAVGIPAKLTAVAAKVRIAPTGVLDTDVDTIRTELDGQTAPTLEAALDAVSAKVHAAGLADLDAEVTANIALLGALAAGVGGGGAAAVDENQKLVNFMARFKAGIATDAAAIDAINAGASAAIAGAANLDTFLTAMGY